MGLEHALRMKASLVCDALQMAIWLRHYQRMDSQFGLWISNSGTTKPAVKHNSVRHCLTIRSITLPSPHHFNKMLIRVIAYTRIDRCISWNCRNFLQLMSLALSLTILFIVLKKWHKNCLLLIRFLDFFINHIHFSCRRPYVHH